MGCKPLIEGKILVEEHFSLIPEVKTAFRRQAFLEDKSVSALYRELIADGLRYRMLPEKRAPKG